MTEQKYHASLTGVRAIAAYMVYIFHFNPFIPEKFGNFIFDFFNQFNAGVSIFFVLSGFLISARYQESMELNSTWFKQYFLKRFARIYPVYFILVTLTFSGLWFNLFPVLPQTTAEGVNTFVLYLTNLTFTQGFFDVLKNTGLPQAWSLTVEECFYFSAPLFFIFRKRIPLLIQVVLILILGIVLTEICSTINFLGFFSSLKFTLKVTFFGRIFEFYAGIKLFDFYKKYTDKMSTDNSIPWRTLAGATGLILTMGLLVPLSGEAFQEGYKYLYKIFVFNWVMPAFIVLLFWGLLSEKSFVRRLLETNTFQLLGKSSYAFYLLHMGSLQLFFFSFFNTNYTLVFLALVMVSILFYKLVEEPLQKRILKDTLQSETGKAEISTN